MYHIITVLVLQRGIRIELTLVHSIGIPHYTSKYRITKVCGIIIMVRPVSLFDCLAPPHEYTVLTFTLLFRGIKGTMYVWFQSSNHIRILQKVLHCPVLSAAMLRRRNSARKIQTTLQYLGMNLSYYRSTSWPKRLRYLTLCPPAHVRHFVYLSRSSTSLSPPLSLPPSRKGP